MNRPSLRTVLGYGAVAGIVAFCLKLISLSPIALDWGRELMAAAVALLGVAVGVWLFRRRPAPGTAAAAEAAPAAEAASLSMREREVLRLLVEGLSNKALARRLSVSENTIKTHLASIYGKLGVAGRVQAVLAAQRMGLTAPAAAASVAVAESAPDLTAAHPNFTRSGDGRPSAR